MDTPVDASAVWSHASGDAAAPAILLVHGSMDRSAGLLRLSRRLRSGDHDPSGQDAGWRVVRYDRRGYGKSLGVGPRYRVADHVGDLAKVIEVELVEAEATGRSGGAPVAVFGHSFGGNVALALACAHPDLVSAVATYESPMSWCDWWPDTSAGGEALSADSSGDAAEAFMRAIVGAERWDRVPDRIRAARRAEGPAMVAELADLRSAPPWSADRVGVPVLAVHGERARPHHRRAMEEIATSVADGRLVEITGAGHTGPNTHAEAIAAELVSFLSEHRAG